jgi:hypothetical protein
MCPSDLTGERGEPRVTPDRRGLHGRLLLEGHMQRAVEKAAHEVVGEKLEYLEIRVICLEDMIRLLEKRAAALETVNEAALDELDARFRAAREASAAGEDDDDRAS